MWSAGYGLPDVYHPDEPRIVMRAVHFYTGDLNPRFFNWPSLSMYLLSGVYGLTVGAFGHAGVVESFSRDPAPFYLLGRLVTALFGTATIAVLYVVALEAYGNAVALVASLFLTVNLLHVRDSQFITTDVPLTFFVTVALLFVLRYWRAGRPLDLVWGGLLAGGAMSMKYPGGLMLLPLLLAHLLRPGLPGQSRWRRVVSPQLALAGVVAGIGFVAGTPYALLTPRAFVGGVLSELHEVGSVQFGNEGDLPSPLFHLLHSLPEAMGVPVLACALVGLALVLCTRTSRDAVVLAFPLPYFLVIGSWSSRFERYTLPLVPFLALLGGIGLVLTGRWLRARRWGMAECWRPGLGLAVIASLLVVPQLVRIAHFHALLARPDTRALAAAWIEREVPVGSRVALEPYTPSLPVVPATRGYQVLRLDPYDVDGLLQLRVEYVVLSGFMYRRYERDCGRFPTECRFYTDLQERGTLLVALDPGPAGGQPFWVGDIYSPLTRLSERTHPGPGIKIYRLPSRPAS